MTPARQATVREATMFLPPFEASEAVAKDAVYADLGEVLPEDGELTVNLRILQAGRFVHAISERDGEVINFTGRYPTISLAQAVFMAILIYPYDFAGMLPQTT